MSSRLRIAMLVGTFPVVSETFIVRQINGLLDLGHEVEIIANARGAADTPEHPELNKHELLKRVRYVEGPPESLEWELPVWPLTGRTWPPGSEVAQPNWRRLARVFPRLARCLVSEPVTTCRVLSARAYGYRAASFSMVYRLHQLLPLRRRYDVLHAQFGPTGNSFRFARELCGVPMVVSFHGYDFSTRPRLEGRGMYEALFRTCDRVIANSSYTRDQLVGLGCPLDRMDVLPVGLDTREFAAVERRLKPGEPVRVLSVGRLVEIKGHENVLRAVGQLCAQGRLVRFDLVGEGPLRGRLEAVVEELGLKDVVVFHGARTSGEVREWMAAAHLFVMASIQVEGDREGQGLVLQEAQASGLPVVATNHGALPEGMLSERSGFLVPEGDVGELARRLGWLMDRPHLWGEMGAQGRRFVEGKYEGSRVSGELVNIYERAMDSYARI